MLLDVNVLVGALREDAPRHAVMRSVLERCRASAEPFGVSDLVLSGALRVLTHPRVFSPPTPMRVAHEFIRVVRASPNAVVVAPGPRHWEIFDRLLSETGATGNLVSDCWHAAVAIEHGCEWWSDDADFARFPSLRWRRPAPG